MKKLILKFLLILCVINTNAQNGFYSLFSYIDNSYPYDIALTLDNNIIMTGTKTQSQLLFGNDGLLLTKINNNGNSVFTVAYDSAANADGTEAVLATSDSNYVCVGRELSYSGGNLMTDIWINKLNKNGVLIWSKSLDCGNTSDIAHDIIEDPNGGYIIAANTDFGSALGGEIFLFKLDINGNLVWKNKLTVNSINNEGRYLTKCANYFYVSGFHGVFSTTQAQTTLAKVDYNGTVKWYKEFDVTGNNNSTLTGISATSDGGCLITSSNSIQKVDSNANSIWSYNYSSITGIELGKTIQLNNGEYLATATNSSFSSLLVKFDANMNILWIHSFSNTVNAGYELLEKINEGYCFVCGVNGSANIPGMSDPKGALIQTDTLGFATCGTNYISPSNLVLTVNPPTITNVIYTVSSLGYLSTISNLPQKTPSTQFLPKCGNYDAGISEIITPDTSILCNATQNLKVKIKNYSSSLILPSAYVRYNLNGTLGVQTSYTLNLAPNADTTISIGTIVLNNGVNNLSVWAWYDPTFTHDSNPLNDTMAKVINVGLNNNLTSNLTILNNSVNVCLGDTLKLFPTFSLGSYNYSWQSSANGTTLWSNVTGQSNSQLTFVPSASIYYRLIVSDPSGPCNLFCDTIHVIVSQINTSIIANGGLTFCQGDSLLLTSNISNVLSYQWMLNGVNIVGATNSNYYATQAGNYKLKTTYATGCSGLSNSIITTVIQTANASISSNGTNICIGNTLQINCTNATSHQWFLNGVILAGMISQNITITQPGTYTCVTNLNYCPDTSNAILVTANPVPTTPIIVNNNNVLSCNSTGVTYQWYLNGTAISGATNSTFTPIQNGGYYVIVSALGCISTPSNSINLNTVGVEEINDIEKSLIYPNPSKNGIFYLDSKTINENREYVIYNIIGVKIKEGNLSSKNKYIDLSNQCSGIYFLYFNIKLDLHLYKLEIQ